jgi:hypothetical protein
MIYLVLPAQRIRAIKAATALTSIKCVHVCSREMAPGASDARPSQSALTTDLIRMALTPAFVCYP